MVGGGGGGGWNLENNVNLSAESFTIVAICNAVELYFQKFEAH